MYNVILTGAGFLADAYDLFVINVVVDIMSNLAYKQPLTATVQANVKSMALVGAFFGQIFFGALADIIGRKRVFISTCAMVIIGAIMSASVVDSESWGIYSQLALWRVVLGCLASSSARLGRVGLGLLVAAWGGRGGD